MFVRHVDPVSEWVAPDLAALFARERELLKSYGLKDIAVRPIADTNTSELIATTVGGGEVRTTLDFDPDRGVFTLVDEQGTAHVSEPVRLDDAFRVFGRPARWLGRGSTRIEQQRALGTDLLYPIAQALSAPNGDDSQPPEKASLTPHEKALAHELVGLGHFFPSHTAPRWQQRAWCRRIFAIQSELGVRPWQKGAASKKEVLTREVPETLRVLETGGSRFVPLIMANRHGKITGAATTAAAFVSAGSAGVGAVATTDPGQRVRYALGWLVGTLQMSYCRNSYRSSQDLSADELGRVPQRLIRGGPRGAPIRGFGVLGSVNGLGRALLAGTSDPPPGMDVQTNRAFAAEIGTRWAFTSNGLAYGSYTSMPARLDRDAVDVEAREILENSGPYSAHVRNKKRSAALHHALDSVSLDELSVEQRERLASLLVEHGQAWDRAQAASEAVHATPPEITNRPSKENWRNARKQLVPQFVALGATYPVAQAFGHPELALFAVPNFVLNFFVHGRNGAFMANRLPGKQRRARRLVEQQDANSTGVRERVNAKLHGETVPPVSKPKYVHRPDIKPYLVETAWLTPFQTAAATIAVLPPSMRSTMVGMIASNAVTGPLKFTEAFAIDTWRTRSEQKADEIDRKIDTQKLINSGVDEILDALAKNTDDLLRDEKAFHATTQWARSAGLLREVADGEVEQYVLAVDGEHAAELQGIWGAIQEMGLDDLRRHFLTLFAASNKQPDRFRARLMSLVSDYDDKLGSGEIPSTVAMALRQQLSSIARELGEARIRWNGIREHLPGDDVVAHTLRDAEPFGDIDVLDAEALRFARVINSLPGADAGERLAAIAVQAAGQLGGVHLGEEQTINVDAMIAHLAHASRVIDQDVERVRNGQSLIFGRADSLPHQRSAKATMRHIAEQLAQSTDLDAPLSPNYGGDRAAYFKQTIECMAAAQCQMTPHAVSAVAKISAEDGGGILDCDEAALREVLRAQRGSISFDHPEAQIQAAMNGETVEALRDELCALLLDEEASVSLKHLDDGSAVAAVSAKPFKWDSPGDNSGFLMRMRDVSHSGGFATEVCVQARIVPTPPSESQSKAKSLRRRMVPSRFRAPDRQLSSPVR